MKTRRHKRSRPARAAQAAFVRGAVASGIVAVAEARGGGLSRAQIARMLKAGIAIAGGVAVADALEREAPAEAVLALAGGIIGAVAVDRLLQAVEQESEGDGQEEIG